MNMQRRAWLQWAALSASTLAVSTRVWATPRPAPARLVFVMLRGAYDGLSALVPYADAFYYEARPSIAIASPPSGSTSLRALMGVALSDSDNLADLEHAVRLDGRWGLHPRLVQPLGGLLHAGQLAFVPFSGTGFESRSHFDAQDWLEAGQPATAGRPDTSVGFLNRLAGELAGGAKGGAVSFTNALPVAMRGPLKVGNAPVMAGKKYGADLNPDFEAQVLAMYQDHAWEPMAEEGTGLRRALADSMQQEMQASARGAPQAQGFALEAQRIGRFLHDHPKAAIAFLDVGGWDTHAGQGGVKGVLATRLESLSRGLQGLTQGLGPSWSSTVVVVVSEFGRTFRENGSKGTDHGHGNVMWLAGGAVSSPGVVVGEQTTLNATSLHQGRDLPVLNDYRNVIAGLLQRMYGLDAAALSRVFPNVKPQALGVI